MNIRGLAASLALSALASSIAAIGAPRVAAAQTTPPQTPAALPQRAGQLTLEKDTIKLSVSYRDVIDAEISRKLLSGLPTVITMRGYVFRESGGDPIALTAKTCRVVYDLWDEVFRIQLTQPGSQTNVIAVNAEGVLRNCGEARKIALIERALVKEGSKYFVAILVEVNPVSAEMLDRIKRWVTRPNGGAAIGPGDSLFGSFVGLFVARIESADRRITFRTQAFSAQTLSAPP